MLDEFTDVNKGEKAVMKLWNAFVRRRVSWPIADSAMLPLLGAFARAHVPELRRWRNNFALHVALFAEYGFITASDVCTLMAVLDDA